MWWKYAITGLIFVVIAFCVGRSCVPTPVNTRQRAEDSLKRIEIGQNALILRFNKDAESAYNRGIEEGRKHAIRVVRYVHDTTGNYLLRKTVIDSSKNVKDWDMETELGLSWEGEKSNAAEISDLKIAYAKKDSALTICQRAGKTDSTLVGMVNQDKKQLKKEVRKQKRLKWLAIVAGAVALVTGHF